MVRRQGGGLCGHSRRIADRLAAFLARRIARESNALAKARAGVEAFYRYYQKSPTNFGSAFIFRAKGVQPVGLKPELDRDLNARLALAFGRIAEAISGAGFEDPDGRAADGISHASGLLILATPAA